MSEKTVQKIAGLNDSERRLLNEIQRLVESYFAGDIRRITHAHDVTAHIINLLQYVDADPVIAIAAGYLHDIGIPEAERKYGRCDGPLQEQEGPPVARSLLADAGADEMLSLRVCELVANHHTPRAIDSPEFRILWDADALVNLASVVEGKSRTAVKAILSKALVTEPGYRMAKNIYLD